MVNVECSTYLLNECAKDRAHIESMDDTYGRQPLQRWLKRLPCQQAMTLHPLKIKTATQERHTDT